MKKKRLNKRIFKKRMIELAIILVALFLITGFVKKITKSISKSDEEPKVNNSQSIEAAKEKPVKEITPIINAKDEARDSYGIDAHLIQDRIERGDFFNEGKKWVFLTFDDGPSDNVTPVVLDALERNEVPATFFIPGNTLVSENSRTLLKKILEQGHSVANHSYSHDYNLLYPNGIVDIERFMAEFDQTQKAFQDILGENFKTTIIRAPGGMMSWQNTDALREELARRGISAIDWNAVCDDGISNNLTTDHVYNRVVETSEGKEIVILLMHDSPAKMSTAQSLDRIIKYYKDNGYEFKTLI